MYRLSNTMIGYLNLLTLLASIPIIGGALWLARSSSTCESSLQTPLLAVGFVILIVSLAGFIGACFNVLCALWLYLFAMLLLIVALLCITAFGFAVTGGGDGVPVAGRIYREYRLSDYSAWLRRRIEIDGNWRAARDCVVGSRVCENVASWTPVDYLRRDLSPIQFQEQRRRSKPSFTHTYDELQFPERSALKLILIVKSSMGAPNALPSRISIVSSSPGRSEKFPTLGFARLLRGNGGSRSRTRTSLTRSSPLFPSRNRGLARSATSMDSGNEGDPSSPKVTCIGQVRIRKKHIKSIRSTSNRNRPQLDQIESGEREMRCCFISKSLLCSTFRRRQMIWKRWSARFSFKGITGYRRGNERIEPTDAIPMPLTRDLVETVPEFAFHKSKLDEEDESADCKESQTRDFVPPKNALILMRCRSAPHNRSSALANRFVDDNDSRIEEGEVSRRTEINQSFLSDGSRDEEEDDDVDSRCPSSRPFFLKRCNSDPGKKEMRLFRNMVEKKIDNRSRNH